MVSHHKVTNELMGKMPLVFQHYDTNYIWIRRVNVFSSAADDGIGFSRSVMASVTRRGRGETEERKRLVAQWLPRRLISA